MTASRYCPPCGENWPNTRAYKTCPGCGQKTTGVPGMIAMGGDEASQRAADLSLARDRHEQFADFMMEREGPTFRAELDAFTGVPE